jgi:DNA-directed RNA polymerase specialized sigma24 family protein
VRDEDIVAQRDDELFAELYPSLRRFAAVVRPVEEDPDELVQEALTGALALRPLSSYENPQAYLRKAIMNLASNRRRSLARRRRADARVVPLVELQPTSYPSDLDDLRRLDVRDRAVLYLSLVEGHSYREISEILGCNEVSARARASRALRRFRVDLRAEIADA